MSGRRIVLLAVIGLVPIVIALWVAGFDVGQQLGRYVDAVGVIAGQEVYVASPTGGQVSDVLVQPGQRVQPGEPLLRVTPTGGGGPTDVTAPSAGAILQVSAVLGQAVKSGERLATLDASPRLHAIAYVPESSIAQVRPGQAADLTVPAIGQTFSGTVREVLPAGSVQVTGAPLAEGAGTPGSAVYPVWVDFDYGSAELKVAMSVSVRIYR